MLDVVGCNLKSSFIAIRRCCCHSMLVIILQTCVLKYSLNFCLFVWLFLFSFYLSFVFFFCSFFLSFFLNFLVVSFPIFFSFFCTFFLSFVLTVTSSFFLFCLNFFSYLFLFSLLFFRFFLLYPRIHVVYKGVYRNQRVVGWSVGRAGAKLRRKLLPQFLTDSHEIWHRCLSWGVDVQDTFFDSGKKWGEIGWSVGRAGGRAGGRKFASRTTSSVFDRFSWNLAQMFVLGCRCPRHIFRQWQKVRCHGNGILWAKNGGKLVGRSVGAGGRAQICVANYFLSFWPILMKFGTDVCLGV